MDDAAHAVTRAVAHAATHAVRVLVVDDHPVVRFGLRKLIEGSWPGAIVDEAGSLASARAQARSEAPDVITLDLSLPDAEGLEALSQMLRVVPDVPILVVSQVQESTHSQRVMQMGAAGCLSKDRTGDELIVAIRRILQGGRYVTPELATQLLSMLEGKVQTLQPHERLTTQEYRVMQFIASGAGPSKIAKAMNLSVQTVANYRGRILKKTGWRHNTDLTKYCVQHGLTTPE